MLESNTEAKRTTGTGSKQGRKGGGVQLPLGTLVRALESGPLYHSRDMLSLHPRELDTRGPLVDKGWQGGDGNQGLGLCPHLQPLSHTIKHPFMCGQLGESETESLWNSGA